MSVDLHSKGTSGLSFSSMPRRPSLYGTNLFRAPALRRWRRRNKVWIPDGEWIHIFTGEKFTIGWYRIGAPMGSPVVFVRQDASLLQELSSPLTVGN